MSRFISFLLSLLVLFPFSAKAQAPYAHTLEAWRVRQDGATYTATLAGMASANAAAPTVSRAYFKWRERGAGSWNQTANQTVTAGNNVSYLTQTITGLGVGKVFEYYMVSSYGFCYHSHTGVAWFILKSSVPLFLIWN